ncbi:6432_t:CDS:2 [Racocetra fulgida]|uniref:6432_t:CDS:1 n=1 Tax=Racocetra fulgida TaxID=60492 RepID=A0A9N9D8I5_9GLOM|nr:6432_t:CDS:2 [Racocetra fulgida]
MESLKDASQKLKSSVKNSISLSAEHLINSGKVLVEKAAAVREKIGDLGVQFIKDDAVLCKAGIPATVIYDSAVGYVIDKVDAVFVGAEGVVENGGLINAIGTYQLAIVAKAANKPFYAVIER